MNNSTNSKTSQNSSSIQTVKSPLPSYDEIRRKSEVEMLKISSYFKGKTEYTVEDKGNENKKDKVSEVKTTAEPEPILPLLDKHAQGALRRRIVHDQLERV